VLDIAIVLTSGFEDLAVRHQEHRFLDLPRFGINIRVVDGNLNLHRISASPPPWRVIQKSDIIGILYESDNTWRQIFLDGRELGNNFLPAYLGYSTGEWDGDALVVDTRGFNGKTWLDQTGKPTSEALHVTERLQRKDFGHIPRGREQAYGALAVNASALVHTRSRRYR